jgi:hypothetical protein
VAPGALGRLVQTDHRRRQRERDQWLPGSIAGTASSPAAPRGGVAARADRGIRSPRLGRVLACSSRSADQCPLHRGADGTSSAVLSPGCRPCPGTCPGPRRPGRGPRRRRRGYPACPGRSAGTGPRRVGRRRWVKSTPRTDSRLSTVAVTTLTPAVGSASAGMEGETTFGWEPGQAASRSAAGRRSVPCSVQAGRSAGPGVATRATTWSRRARATVRYQAVQSSQAANQIPRGCR